MDPILLSPKTERIDLTQVGEFYQGRGDSFQILTAPDPAGIRGRMVVKARNPGTDPNWVVFALKNPTKKRLERWLVADRYEIIGSKILGPDLDRPRIVAVTPSVGFKPERIASDLTDIFKLTIEPGSTVTFVAELTPGRFPRLFLWRADAYEKKRRNRTLFDGILLGITGLLAIFLTAIFAANHKAVFPASALLAWSVLAYLCVDFGFLDKLFELNPADNAIYRAATEAAMAAAMVIFLFTFLRLGLWHGWVRWFFVGWILAQIALVPFAVIDAPLVAMLARLSFGAIAVMGSLIIAYLAVRGQSRAFAIFPAWLLFLTWLFGAAVAMLGMLSGEIVVAGLNAGLVLVLSLFGFTVTQFAFRAVDPMAGAPPSQLQQKALAIEGAGASVWEWSARRDEITVGQEVEEALGLSWGTLNCPVTEWLHYLHPADRDRFRIMLSSIRERNGGALDLDFRMRRSDGSYLWFELKAHSVPVANSRALRCVGLMQDVTAAKRAQERLMHDAVHDSLTGLPNRELFLDRLDFAVTRAREEGAAAPTVFLIDIDRFKNVNSRFGMGVGDTMLLTVSRRLARHLKPQDTLARVGGDQFAILLVTETEPQQIALLAERVRRALRAPMTIAGEEIVLTSSMGIVIYDGKQKDHRELFREAEIAMYRAKRAGKDRIEIFKPAMRGDRDDRVTREMELRRAVARKQLKILYQPIMRLARNELVGFEALLRWEHPKFGVVNPSEFIPIAEETGLIAELGSYVLEAAVDEAAHWHKMIPNAEEPLFVSVNVSSRQLFRQELIQDVRHILGRQKIPPEALRLEVTESLVMENVEQAAEILDWLKSLQAGLSLDDFGTGYSSLAYLYRFPFDTIKVDQDIVQHRSSGESGLVILRSIVALAHELGKDVVAEGVETPEDAAYLRTIRCDYAQGFYYGEPMTSREVRHLLAALVKTGRMAVEPPSRSRRKAEGANASSPTSNAHSQPNGPDKGGQTIPPRSKPKPPPPMGTSGLAGKR